MNRPVHFEIHSSDPARTNAFFERVFGWSMSVWPGEAAFPYWIAQTGAAGPGIDGGVMQSRDGQPRTVNTIEVNDVDVATAHAVEAGGQVVVPRMAIAGVGYLAYCVDPTGVLFGVMHADASAR